jgi:hypothetical protein
MSKRSIKKRRIAEGPVRVCLAVIMGLLFCLAAETLPLGLRTSQAATAGPADEYDIIVYEGRDFAGVNKKYTVTEGNCQKQVINLTWEWDKLNDKITSVRVGSRVAVVLFQHANYSGEYIVLSESTPDLGARHFNDRVTSLIVFLKEQGSPVGVHLFGSHKTFYPVKENCECVPFCRYDKLVHNDDATKVRIYPMGPGQPGYGKLSVLLQQHAGMGEAAYFGNNVTLPPPLGPRGGDFDLGKYQLSGKVSQLTMNIQGNFPVRPGGPPRYPDKQPSAPTAQVDPHTVYVNQHIDFVGWIWGWSVESGTYQTAVPDVSERMLNDKISSIRIGSKVAVILFVDKNYTGKYIVLDHPVRDLSKIGWNDKVSSLIVFEKAIGPLGVHLMGSKSQFYPVTNTCSPVSYPTLVYNDDAQKVYMTLKDPKIKGRGLVRATLFEHKNFEGRALPLSAAPFTGEYDLGKLDFKGKPSSLKVECVAPPSGGP